MIFKVAFGKQIHLINSQDKHKLAQLFNFIPSIFKSLPSRYTLTYLDEDGDEITLKEQEDYDVLLGCGLKTVKITIRENLEEFVDQTNQIVIEELPLKEQEKVQEVSLDQPVQPSNSTFTQEIDEALIEEKLKSMIPDIVSKIKSEISEEIMEKSKSSIQNQPIIVEEPIYKKQYWSQPEKTEPKVEKTIHKGVTCDSCGFKDIEGVRYKCSVCNNFDFCQKCEATVEHDHPFLKIKTLKQTPVKIFTIINDDENPSIEVNGQAFNAPPCFDNLVNHGFNIMRGFFGGESREELKNKVHAAKAEWMKNSEQWKNCWKCPAKSEEKPEEKPEQKPEEKPEVKKEQVNEVKVEKKVEEKKEEEKPKVSKSGDAILLNAKYLEEVFGYPSEKCLRWAQMFPFMNKEELLNYCLAEPSFYN